MGVLTSLEESFTLIGESCTPYDTSVKYFKYSLETLREQRTIDDGPFLQYILCRMTIGIL